MGLEYIALITAILLLWFIGIFLRFGNSPDRRVVAACMDWPDRAIAGPCLCWRFMSSASVDRCHIARNNLEHLVNTQRPRRFSISLVKRVLYATVILSCPDLY